MFRCCRNYRWSVEVHSKLLAQQNRKEVSLFWYATLVLSASLSQQKVQSLWNCCGNINQYIPHIWFNPKSCQKIRTIKNIKNFPKGWPLKTSAQSQSGSRKQGRLHRQALTFFGKPLTLRYFNGMWSGFSADGNEVPSASQFVDDRVHGSDNSNDDNARTLMAADDSLSTQLRGRTSELLDVRIPPPRCNRESRRLTLSCGLPPTSLVLIITIRWSLRCRTSSTRSEHPWG